jgi:hypothetical protein
VSYHEVVYTPTRVFHVIISPTTRHLGIEAALPVRFASRHSCRDFIAENRYAHTMHATGASLAYYTGGGAPQKEGRHLPSSIMYVLMHIVVCMRQSTQNHSPSV